MVQWRSALPVHGVCRVTAGSVGKIWRARRRHLPPDVKALMAELLLACKSHSLPDAALVVEAGPQGISAEPAASKADSLDSGMVNRAVHQRKVRKMVTFGGAEIHEFIPFRSALAADEQDNQDRSDRRLEAIALRRDIGDLEAVMARMTVIHQSQMSNLRWKMEDTAAAMQQGMSTLTEQVSAQTSCLTDALRVNREIPYDAPV